MKPFNERSRALLDKVHEHVGFSESMRLAQAYDHGLDALDDDRWIVAMTAGAALTYGVVVVAAPETEAVITALRVAGAFGLAMGATLLIRKKSARDDFEQRWFAKLNEQLQSPSRFEPMAMLDSFPLLTIRRSRRLKSLGRELRDAVDLRVPPAAGFSSVIDEASHVLRVTGGPLRLVPFAILCIGMLAGAVTPLLSTIVGGLFAVTAASIMGSTAGSRAMFVSDLRDRTNSHRAKKIHDSLTVGRGGDAHR